MEKCKQEQEDKQIVKQHETNKKVTTKKIYVTAVAILAIVVLVVCIIGNVNFFQANAGPALCFEYYDGLIVKDGYVFQVFDQGRLYRIPESGGDKLLLADGVDEFFVDDTWVYYITNSDMRKMHHDGTEDTQIFAGHANRCRIARDVIYFYHQPVGQSSESYCIKTDGTGLHKAYFTLIGAIYDGKNYCFAGDTMIVFHVMGDGASMKGIDLDIPVPGSGLRWDGGACYGHDDWIYYNASLEKFDDSEAIKTNIRRVRINGKEDQLFVENGFIREISDGYVYYQDNSNDFAWGRIKVDGTENQRNFLPEGAEEYLGSSDQWIYYALATAYDDRTYWRVKPDGSATEQVAWRQ